MKIRDIVPAAYQQFGTGSKRSYGFSTVFMPLYENQPLYTQEQMQEYAKAKAYETINTFDWGWTKKQFENNFGHLFGDEK